MKLTKNFSLSEFASKDGAEIPFWVDANLLILAEQLQVLRDYFGVPITINSGYRSPEHNLAVGGSKNSQHLLGKAGDIRVKGKSPLEVYQAIELLIKDGKMLQGGLGLYDTFVHYDWRGTRARWDNRKKKDQIKINEVGQNEGNEQINVKQFTLAPFLIIFIVIGIISHGLKYFR